MNYRHPPVPLQSKRVPWRQYQEDARVHFLSLGLDAVTDVELHGARAAHQIDVVVRFVRFGIEHKWIVECKHWKRRITKAHVLTAIQVGNDVGADRVIVLSERGFQPGAVAAAEKTNVTLTSLATLQGATAVEVAGLSLSRQELILYDVERRLQHLLGDWVEDPRVSVTEAERKHVIELLGDCLNLVMVLRKVRLGQLPVTVEGNSRPAGSLVEAEREVRKGIDRVLGQALPILASWRDPAATRKSFRALKRAIASHLKVGEQFIQDRDPSNIAIAKEVVTSMQLVGERGDELRRFVSADARQALHSLMRALIDGPYVVLSTPIPEISVWREAETRARTSLRALEEAMPHSSR
jgi:hypothetical protein